ncbi:MAG TPA: PP2C family protein-serine/threonine phosphatase [Marinospirillum sp.]|uniref:PP2C family protein-serine/threonine phosphatase n=1 Tax=Marinospirillum sp. TaxID=2183934 RepID=UPI002B46C420|nr:PP2C family protein-serine/threonine phosphatase [Marinospirillum sp.]HKM14440.1 PP2C family protein-serine/threonine phosphatase [Marinospirillum sp.]
MIKFFFKKIRTLRWFIFLAVFFSTSIVFIGVSGISSFLYENLMAEQANDILKQLKALPIESRPKIQIPNITNEVRLTYLGAFFLYSFIFLTIAFIFSHFAIRRINQSIEDFSQQINQIQTGSDLKNFNPNNLDFVFNELNQSFNNISTLARYLGEVLNDKHHLEIEASLLSNLVIKNTRLDNWDEYIKAIFIDINKTLPFDFISVYLTENKQKKLKIYWFGKINQATKTEAENLFKNEFNKNENKNRSIKKSDISHQYLTDQLVKDHKIQSNFLVKYLEKEPQIGCIQGVFIHSMAMNDLSLRLRINSLLVLLLNLLGSSRAISGYTQQLEKSIHLSEQENAMAAEVLYGHLLVKNTDDLTGINYKICSSSRFSGDIIQIKRSPSGSTFILVADATGHGLSATITIMPVISVFNAMVQKGYQLPFILNEMNKHLVKDLPDDRFVAAVLVEIDPIYNEVSIWNGAMPPVLQLNSQGEVIASFKSKHMALGILDEAMFDSNPQYIKLPDDGHLIVYSDGLTEQESLNNQAFGHEQLISNLQEKINNDPVNTIIQTVLDYAQLEQPDDDISLCQIEFSNIEIEKKATNITLLFDNFNAPFEWQIKIYGQQIAQQSLSALCNEFMQTQGLSMPIKRWAFSVIHELVQIIIDTNLLKINSIATDWDYNHKKSLALKNLSNDHYLKISVQGNLKDTCKLSTSVEKPCLIIEVSDNSEDDSCLMQKNCLKNIQTLADKMVISQQGHHIKVSIG